VTTNPHVCNNFSIIGQKELGQGKAFNKRKGGESVVTVNNHGYPA
jgi:hypothetical protein